MWKAERLHKYEMTGCILNGQWWRTRITFYIFCVVTYLTIPNVPISAAWPTAARNTPWNGKINASNVPAMNEENIIRFYRF